MDWQKTGLISGIIVLTLFILFKWNAFQTNKQNLAEQIAEPSATIPAEITQANPTRTNSAQPVVPTQNTKNGNEIPIAPSAQAEGSAPTPLPENNKQLISVSTDTLDLVIDLYGGDIVKAVLPQHKVKLGGEQGFTLLERTNNATYIAQSGLVGPNGTDTAKGRPLFNSASERYQLNDNEDSIAIDLLLTQENVNIIKRFELTRGEYEIKVRYLIDNQSSKSWRANFYGQIKRDSHQPPAAADSGFGVSPYLGAATTTDEDQYKKISFKDLRKQNTDFGIQGGWVAMVQHYFTSAWIGNAEQKNEFFLKKLNNQDMYLLGYIAPQTLVAANSQGEINSRYYIGPKDIDRLEAIAPYLDLTIDFGWLWWIAKPLFLLLDFLHDFIGNWGWAIIALTLIIKAVFFYPSAMSYRSMARMRKVTPKMQAIKDRYGDDRQKMSQEMMKLYKTEKVNPMGGCLPILIQMPVFIALYWVLMESVEIRHAPFALWIQDLSVMDPYFVFPLIMGATMFIQQQLNPTPPDPMQAKIMKWMPVGFTFLFLWFPAGLVIYWVTNNTLSIIQQYIITKGIEAGK